MLEKYCCCCKLIRKLKGEEKNNFEPPDGVTSDGTKRPRHESFMGKIIDKRFLTISVALYRVYETSSPSYFLH